MNAIIKNNENITDIALAYYDEKEELLKEINSENLYFTVYPFSVTHKRLYLIGDLIYTNNNITVTGTSSDDYTIKLLVIDKFNSLDDFSDSSNSVSCRLSSNYLNTIPIDILIESQKNTINTVNLELAIEVGSE